MQCFFSKLFAVNSRIFFRAILLETEAYLESEVRAKTKKAHSCEGQKLTHQKKVLSIPTIRIRFTFIHSNIGEKKQSNVIFKSASRPSVT